MRKSPTDSATMYAVGHVMIGNDGNDWKIVKNINGIKRWQLIKINNTDNSDDSYDTRKTSGLMYQPDS